MFNITQTSKRIIAATFCISAAAAAVGVAVCLFTDNRAAIVPFVIGVIVGTVFAALKMILIERTYNRSLDMQPQMSTNYVRLHFILRYTLTGAILAVAALNPGLSLIGVALGLFSMQPAAYAVNFIFNKPRHKKTADE